MFPSISVYFSPAGLLGDSSGEPPNACKKIVSLQGGPWDLYLRAPERSRPGILMKKKKPGSSSKKLASAKPEKDFSAVFGALQEILKPYEQHLHVLPYKPKFYALVTRLPVHKEKPVWFAAIRMGKNYVSYHFMPVYMNPAMQKRIPPELKKRMQGKACFNFSEVDPPLFGQLANLTAAGFEGYRALKYV
jgi:hypothetical protein